MFVATAAAHPFVILRTCLRKHIETLLAGCLQRSQSVDVAMLPNCCTFGSAPNSPHASYMLTGGFCAGMSLFGSIFMFFIGILIQSRYS